MTTTSKGTAHRHKTKAGYWSDKTDTDSGSTHTHDIDLAGYVPRAAFDMLVNRVEELEAVVAVFRSSFTTQP